MTRIIETVTLTETVGAEVRGVDVDRLLHDEDLPRGRTTRWRPTACSSSAISTSTTPPRWRSAIGSVGPRSSARANTPRSSSSPSTRRRTVGPYLRSTFDWHIDGLTDDVPIMATILTATVWRTPAARREFASTYAAYDDLTHEERDRFGSIRVVHTIEASQRRLVADPTRRAGGDVAGPAGEGAAAHLATTATAGARSSSGRPPITSWGWSPTRVRPSSATSSPGRPRRTGSTVYGRAGDLVIWDNRGVLHRACPTTRARPARCTGPRSTETRRSSRVAAESHGRGSSDEVGLVDHARRLAAADADEDALVQPVEVGAAVSIWVEVRKVYSLASTSSPRPRRARTSALPWRTPRDWT